MRAYASKPSSKDCNRTTRPRSSLPGARASRMADRLSAAGNQLNILIIDACRDNPFAGAVNAKGLAPMDAPPGTLLAYSTAPGNVAADGDALSR